MNVSVIFKTKRPVQIIILTTISTSAELAAVINSIKLTIGPTGANRSNSFANQSSCCLSACENHKCFESSSVQNTTLKNVC